jgi:ubiquitin C-terminal hydrolase
MFALRNKNGSCWINAALQAVFRIPDLQTRFNENEEDTNNPVEVCLAEIWGSKGDEGLKAFYDAVKVSSVHMPAGDGIGDSHELIEFLCDKVPFLDKLLRFKVVNTIQCAHCSYSDTKPDTMLEFSIAPTQTQQTVRDAITAAVQPTTIPDWVCDACKKSGCRKQLLLAEFPQVLMFHQTSIGPSVSYTPVLVVNGIRYALLAVICFTGGHWFTWGRNMPPGQPWHRLDDMTVRAYDGTFFPLADNLRLLLYYRLTE